MESLSPHQQMMRMLTGYWASQALYVAAKLGLADSLKDGPRTADDLAAATQAHPGALYRLLRALASVGVFAEDDRKSLKDGVWTPGPFDDPFGPTGERLLGSYDLFNSGYYTEAMLTAFALLDDLVQNVVDAAATGGAQALSAADAGDGRGAGRPRLVAAGVADLSRL